MAPKDYVSRGSKNKKKKKSRTSLLIGIAALILIGFATALYFLKEKTPEARVELTPTEKASPKAVLPTPPKEVWSYIKALETRIVPVDEEAASLDKNLQLTEEQKKVLKEMEREQKDAEIARTQQAQEKALQEENDNVSDEEAREIEARKIAAAERKKQEQQQMALEQKKADEERRNEQVQRQKVVEAKTVQAKSAVSERQFGLQCGAFKNREQAEKLQARLVMAGFNARLTVGSNWNRIIIGPIGNRDEANQALSKAKSIASCVLIAM